MGLSPSDAAHLVVALQLYRKHCATDALPFPDGLAQMEATVSSGVMQGQAGSTFADVPTPAHSADVARDLVTYAQAARMLSCSLSTVKRRVRTGQLVPVRLGGTARLRIAAVRAFIDQGAQAC